MASDLDQTLARIVSAVTKVPSEKIDALLKTVIERNEAGNKTTFEEALVQAKILDPAKAAELRQDAETILEAPEIPGYSIVSKLGEGGMGAVYKALQVSMGREVALKILPAHYAKNQNFVDRFYREARSSARLDHNNVVRGYDVGEAAGVHYFAMELVDGKSVQHYIDDDRALEVGDALKIVYDVAQALVQAQELKMVHRDIKPDNIMVTRKGVVKLADLGLAKQMDDENSMTQTGSGFGTPYYMPPEQAKNAKYVDGRSDIYALGATLYRLVAGQVPFDGETAMEVLIAKEKGTFPKASSANPDVPAKVNILIDKMMAKEPSQRHQTATELVADIEKMDLHNQVLSFVDAVGAAGIHSREDIDLDATGMRAPAKKKTVAPAGKTAAGNRTAGAKAGGKSPPPGKSEPPPGMELWYLRYKDASGKLIKTKQSTSRVRDLIKQNMLDDSVEGCRTPEGPFKRLQAFAEFEPLLRSRIAQRQVDQKSAKVVNKMANLLENFDAETKSHKSKRKFKDRASILWSFVLTIGVLGTGGYFFWKYVMAPNLAETAKKSEELRQQIEKEQKKSGRQKAMTAPP